ncbi:MAG TPA: magnesium transporter [Ruminococcus sp.]|nr:magnesium transporter [Ruminococcus sp.]HCR74118.1 magnesium transporter [Ruminococcus sp.]
MIKYYKTVDNKVIEIEKAETGCWISVISPSEEEVEYLVETYGFDRGFVKSALDEEESSRVEIEEEQTLIIVDYAISQKEEAGDAIIYSTMPLSIIVTKNYVVTVSLMDNVILHEMANGTVKNVQTSLKTRFILLILLRIAAKFLLFLKAIDKMSSQSEKKLSKSLKNKELLQLLALEKSLVYFSTSLKSNEVTLEKILRGRVIKLYEDDQDLLEDVLIEIKQAIEMANIYSNVLSGTMDTFASVISNNLNIVMKTLTMITIIMEIPTIIFSYYGMNVTGLPYPVSWFPVVISLIAMSIGLIIIRDKDR